MKYNIYPILIAVFFLFSFVGCAEKPEQAYKKIIEAAEDEDFGYIYERLDKKSQENYDIRLRHLAQFKISLETDPIYKQEEEEKLKSTSNKELFIRFAKKIVKPDSILKPGPYNVINTQVEKGAKHEQNLDSKKCAPSKKIVDKVEVSNYTKIIIRFVHHYSNE